MAKIFVELIKKRKKTNKNRGRKTIMINFTTKRRTAKCAKRRENKSNNFSYLFAYFAVDYFSKALKINGKVAKDCPRCCGRKAKRMILPLP